MNSCEITGGSKCSSDVGVTLGPSAAPTASEEPLSIKPTTTTTADNNQNKSKPNENLEIIAKCEEKTDETPAATASTLTQSIVAASSVSCPTEVAAPTTSTVSYAALAAMDSAAASAIVCAQRQKQTEALISSSECDKNSTIVCDKGSYKLLQIADSDSVANVECSGVILTIESNKDSANNKSNQEKQDNELAAQKTQEISVLLTPDLSSSEKLKENKEEKKSEAVVNTFSGSKNCGDVLTTTMTTEAQKKIDKNHLFHHPHYALTTTASAPILMQSSDFSRSESSNKLRSSGSGATTTTTSALGSGAMITRRVSFPKSDEALVTGYLEPANPWEHVCMVQSISEIAELYVQSCNKHNTTPIPSVLEHLKLIELDKSIRQPILLLKNIKLTPADCEALEEIFKRVQYKAIDVSSCELNEAAASALFDMFEYYEVTNELDISSNADGMTPRGWTSCIYMVSHSRALQMLNAQGNPLSKNCADSLGSALNSSNLHTIKLEHCGLRGHPLESLCTKLRNNQTLKELWLAYNDLTSLDADKIAQLLKSNHFLQLIDISNNNIKDEGLMKIVKALIEQSTELERQKIAAAALAYAMAEAEHKKRQQLTNNGGNSKNGTNTNNTTANGSNGMGTSTDDEMTSGDSDASPAEEDDDEEDDDDADDADVDTDANDAEDDDATTSQDDGGGSRAEDDDDDEDTVKTSTIKTTPPMNGQSKLDKLLSMNNSDSSEEAPTDTVAASDVSVSDDIFDSTNTITPPLVASTPIVEPILDKPVVNDNNNTTPEVLYEAHESTIDADLAKGAIPTKALDVNKNSTKVEDFDDTHSTDSAFESSSDGDISRHLPEEYVDKFNNKDDVETAVIATEALTTPTPTPPPSPMVTPVEVEQRAVVSSIPKPIEVTPLRQLAASTSPNTSCDSSSGDISGLKNAALTGTSPSPASGMRRTETTCTLNQSTRVRSHSSDSLSSDNSLDGSISDTASGNFSTRINEKLTKNDTLTRQKQFDVPIDSGKIPQGLKALTLWNNNLTKESGPFISDLLATTVSLELLNIGKNILSNDFLAAIRDSLSKNTTVTTLGLQSAHLSCAGIRTLSSILQFGGNSTLHRIDIRDNKIEVESLNMLAEALKSNTTVTQIDIDDEPKRLSIGSDAQLDYARVLGNVRSLCARNENQPPPTASSVSDKATVVTTKRRGGYYLGSRKISLTCHSAPPRAAITDQTTSTDTTPTSSKLEVKKKTGVRLRSPIPSPPTISPSSSPVPSPSKSRFQVFRVSEVSPLTSPMTPSPSPSPTPSPTPSSTASGVIINSKDSTTRIKRLSTSPRSRFQVKKIYEDPGVPIAHRILPPITPSPSPPTAPSISTQPLTTTTAITPTSTPASTSTTKTEQKTTTKSIEPCKFEEQKIITTPATPPILDIETAEPSFKPVISATELEKLITAAQTTQTIAPTISLTTSTKIVAPTPMETCTESATTTATLIPTAIATATATVEATMIATTVSVATATVTATSTPTPTQIATATSTTTAEATVVVTAKHITNNSATNTKSNPNSTILNNSTNDTVKPNVLVDGSESVSTQFPPQDDDTSTKYQKHLCPASLPVIEDEQRTLTNSPEVNIDSIGTITTSCSSAQPEFTIATSTATQSTNDSKDSKDSQELQSQSPAPGGSPAAGRTRKNSWIPNSTYPGTVDRLLSMFQNPTHLFHRSSSPDTTTPVSQEDRRSPVPSDEELKQSLVPVRRRSPPGVSQFPWCKLGTEMCKPVTTVMQSAAAVSSGYVTCGPPTTAVGASAESPRSFFDAASKQLRDFSKQVFRQNIGFGNEATNATQEQQQMTQQLLQHDCDTISSDMQLEIKENISPEHTINEEQLHSLQKIGGSPGSSSTSSSGTETTEGASIPSSSSSPSSLLSVPLIGIPPTIPSIESGVETSIPPTPPTSSSQSQQHVLNEEQSCNS